MVILVKIDKIVIITLNFGRGSNSGFITEAET
jgi:hypothetical protein